MIFLKLNCEYYFYLLLKKKSFFLRLPILAFCNLFSFFFGSFPSIAIYYANFSGAFHPLRFITLTFRELSIRCGLLRELFGSFPSVAVCYANFSGDCHPSMGISCILREIVIRRKIEYYSSIKSLINTSMLHINDSTGFSIKFRIGAKRNGTIVSYCNITTC